MSEPRVRVSQAAAVRTLTLNRPQALNSFTGALHVELLAALDAAASDPAVRCVVLTGAGRAFCAGQDLSDPLAAPPTSAAAAPTDLSVVLDRYYVPLLARLRTLPVPVVAALHRPLSRKRETTAARSPGCCGATPTAPGSSRFATACAAKSISAPARRASATPPWRGVRRLLFGMINGLFTWMKPGGELEHEAIAPTAPTSSSAACRR